ncbi:MAG: hypothetical protein COT24_05540 [Candidatus Kerfeldbacteria bacterium CG08_land_8_20_14_0_20_40_16]|uniref:Cyclic nucleotide-binding protein n=1 Tax=Candidatus Kerfeldbacteria bacterium CG08_land_8_20_14_0_20_40_16 TaxID=2014244 RepID=A0A2H0YUS3_9BACT|nr:MAG: hypothetical protein COT24_05540 [Candidatus Kerfeldbacteria bacterium CG08_land_8_20_14_0_20_40_16]
MSEFLVKTIKKINPGWKSEGYICLDDLNSIRKQYIKELLSIEKGELSSLEEDILKSIKEQQLVSKNINKEFKEKLTFGNKLSDNLARFGGSWRFIILFAIVLFIWILINSLILLKRPFDPYPFILLNLILSCLAALQAPVIMMSQNRQEAKDRLRSEHDYRVDTKAELEIQQLHEKMDHLLMKQWQRLLEIQEIQIDLMDQLANRASNGQKTNNRNS